MLVMTQSLCLESEIDSEHVHLNLGLTQDMSVLTLDLSRDT